MKEIPELKLRYGSGMVEWAWLIQQLAKAKGGAKEHCNAG